MKTKLNCLLITLFGLAATASAATYHVATAQQLQNALTLAAGSTGGSSIYVTNGYYTGNFNYNSTAVNSLTILAETNVPSSQVVIDSGGIGSSMNISGSATANITVQGMTFLRNCGSTTIGGLQIAGGNTTILVSGCQFLSPTNSSGIGLLLSSGINATVTNCIAAGSTTGSGGTGISISGVTNNVIVQSCTISTNTNVGLILSGASVVAVTNCLFTGNTGNGYGGGAECGSTTAIFSGNTFNGNLSGDFYVSFSGYYGNGAGVNCSGTSVILSGNTFTGNTVNATGGGGGAYCYDTTNTLVGNIFTGNYSPGGNGGGAYCPAGTTVTLSGNTFNGNSANGSGGGAYCYGAITLSNNTFTANSAGTSSGGGASCSSGVTNPITISGNTFLQNTAVSGGGIYATGPNINLLDNLVANNTGTNTSSQGGGIWVDASTKLNMINNTVTGNTTPGSGGGVAFIVTGTVELLNVYNNIIWGNSATVSGGDVYLSGTGQKKVFDFNDADSLYGVWDIAVSNLDVSPQFFNPVGADYHIQSTSPCLNAGTNGAPSLPATDLDGSPRIVNGTVDLGCYEFDTAITHPADTNADFVISPAEYSAYAAAWKAGQTWSNAPNVIPANYLTRAGYLMTNGGTYHNDGSARPVNWKTGP
jgi:hypothetical protein